MAFTLDKKDIGAVIAAGTTLTATAFAGAAPTAVIGVENWDLVVLEVTYTPGTGGGAPVLEIMPVVVTSADGVLPATWAPLSRQLAGVPSGGRVAVAVDDVVYTRAAAGTFLVEVPVRAHALLGVLVREAGAPGAFGSVGIEARVSRGALPA